MADALRLAAAILCSTCGMAWLALAMKPHWDRVRGPELRPHGTARSLRALGAGALAGSLLLCLSVDHVSMASLVWVLLLSASALGVAFTLAFRPRWLGWSVGWMSLFG